jgi:hypothetical protein
MLAEVAGRKTSMPTTSSEKPGSSELAIFSRLLQGGDESLSPALARHLLTLGFGPEDQARMSDLAERNQAGALSAAEQEDLRHYVKAGHLLALLHSTARRALKNGRVP